jgi:phytoene synthase
MIPAAPGASAIRALAWLYCPPQQRPALEALCGIESEIAASLAPGLDHQVAHARLAWWRDECTRCASGRAAHPLTRALTACLAGREPAPLAGLAGLVDAAVWDLAAATFETRRELRGYCERWAEGMIVPLMQLTEPAADPAVARALGAALREGELLASLVPQARAGRLRMPLDELAAAGVDPGQLAHPPWPAALAARLRARHEELRAQLATAGRALPAQARAPLRALLVWAALAQAQSRRVARRLPDAARGSDDHGAFDGWRAWRAARRADAGRLALREL